MLPQPKDKTHFFTLRLWHNANESGRNQWRGKLHYINQNDIRYFQDWSALIPVLLAMLRAAQVSGIDIEESISTQRPDGELEEEI